MPIFATVPGGNSPAAAFGSTVIRPVCGLSAAFSVLETSIPSSIVIISLRPPNDFASANGVSSFCFLCDLY